MDEMNIWWKTESLTQEEEYLLNALVEAHLQSSFRMNPSSCAVANSAAGSQDLVKAFAAGLLTLGEKHGPIEQTYRFLSLQCPDTIVSRILKDGEKVPGWGNSFVKGKPDPLWEKVDKILHAYQPPLAGKLDDVTTELHEQGKKIYPNPSAYTAAAAMALGLEAKSAIYLFVSARLDAWAKIATQFLKGGIAISVL